MGARRIAVFFLTLAIVAAETLAVMQGARAAEATTGIIVGRVASTEADRAPIAGARVVAASPSGRYATQSDRSGRFTFVGVAPDTYVLSASAPGYETATEGGITVLPGSRLTIQLGLQHPLSIIGRVSTTVRSGIEFGEAQDVYRVGDANRNAPTASSSGLATYTRATIQGTVAAVPGVQQDQFANVIVHGGKVEDILFTYDGVPVPQALIAEPGGNIVGAQLPATAGYTTVTTAGFSNQSSVGLAGVVDQIPATGTYPGVSTLTLGQGLTPGSREVEFENRWASPDLRARYALDARIANESILYGDGRTFYPSEAATYGLSLASKAAWSVAGNAHLRLGERTDLNVVGLAGEATYDQYGTPFSGQTYGAFDGATLRYPNEPSPDASVATPSRIRGTYAVEKVQLVRSYAHSSLRAQLYRSQYGAATDAPFFDDLSFPNGVISYYGRQSGNLNGFGVDVLNVASERHELGYGAELRSQYSTLDQIVPTLDQKITSHPVLDGGLLYVSDRWSPSSRFTLQGALRSTTTHIARSDGNGYDRSSVDPHVGAVYRFGASALRLTYDRTTVAPLPLQAERVNSSEPAPFVRLLPELGETLQASLERAGALRARLTAFATFEHNLIDVLPANFRTAIAAGQSPGGVGVPTNAGELRAHGLELALDRGPLSLSATYVRAFSSSASQFGYNDLNAPAIAAGHLFPVGYVPDLTALLAYRAKVGRNVTLTPVLSYESGYPYGNGRAVWIFDPVTNKPVQVPNDNHVNPGYSYYFLADPSKPYDPATNPHIGSLGTPEGNDPNTLRSKPQLLVSLHAEATLTPRVSLLFDVANLFGTATPTQQQGNPYLIGPPGYAGGNPLYAAYYGSVFGQGSYTLGNGVPTNNGQTAAVPWTYGTAGYVPSSYPEARSISLRLRIRL